MYNKWKGKGFEVYGICSDPLEEIAPAKEKILKMKMDWINTSAQPYPLLQVKKLYNVTSNPLLILLDNEKNILYKRLDAEQVDKILSDNF